MSPVIPIRVSVISVENNIWSSSSTKFFNDTTRSLLFHFAWRMTDIEAELRDIHKKYQSFCRRRVKDLNIWHYTTLIFNQTDESCSISLFTRRFKYITRFLWICFTLKTYSVSCISSKVNDRPLSESSHTFPCRSRKSFYTIRRKNSLIVSENWTMFDHFSYLHSTSNGLHIIWLQTSSSSCQFLSRHERRLRSSINQWSTSSPVIVVVRRLTVKCDTPVVIL